MEIHALSATEMLAALDAGALSSVEITQACVDRVFAHDERVGALPVRRFEAALSEAAAADARRAAGSAGPLCGLPITVKESLDLEGYASTMGLRARRGHRAPADAVCVRRLRAAGAVVLGKTNVPQLLLAQETENRIWGVTRNPWNLDRSPGGSSGGEAAAIATGMSPCGLGTDIGGSIRIPCHFTGIAGLKPTLDRVSNRGSQGAVPGQELVRSQLGPMARTTADLGLLLSTLAPASQAADDPRVPPAPLGLPGEISLKGLRIGYFEDDGYLSPTPSIVRALRAARASLEAAGATLVPYLPPDAGEVVFLWIAAISGDGGRSIDARLEGEAVSPQIRPSRLMLRAPAGVRRALAAVMERSGERRLARLLRSVGEKRVDALWRLTERRTALRWAEFDAWNRAELDAVLSPPHAIPALAHRASGDFTLSLSYMFRYSLLNFPAGVVPVTRVDERDLRVPTAKGDRVERKRTAIDLASVGLPLGVQVVARPYREDVALAVMGAIEVAARGDLRFPRTPIDPV